ncbi:hypothetical protein [Dethiosulfatarculus sandiegensis]|uniref:Uncharacterized protein n=1 Tax=Dethiosulfatarculus sandiegensis TaxID=1429043 RepID=A0A0D2JEX9_9BACT|nr:hypothetical protein [Dethiosulfatarculus sandiegensis]KIX14236.1 hypothetical protein X474_09640 [Dethiosulfatarculus sandiegensis]
MATNCGKCFLRRHALANPQSILAGIWRWHTGWCSGYKAYKAELAAKSINKPEQGSLVYSADKKADTGNSR